LCLTNTALSALSLEPLNIIIFNINIQHWVIGQCRNKTWIIYFDSLFLIVHVFSCQNVVDFVKYSGILLCHLCVAYYMESVFIYTDWMYIQTRGGSRIFRTSVKIFWRTGRCRRWAWSRLGVKNVFRLNLNW
jgi:hypothetical protein